MATQDLEQRIRDLERELDALPDPKATWFLEPGRAPSERLAAQIAAASASPVIAALLRVGAGAIAVLNAQRQVIAVGERALSLLGVEDPATILGLRLGEAVRCVHAGGEAPAGCGTAIACRTCGAAISVLAALEGRDVQERTCAFTLLDDGALVDTEFRVRAQPVDLGDERVILLSLEDVSVERRRAALERALFQDLSGQLSAIVGACDEMDGASPEEVTLAAADARVVAAQVAQELKLQRALMPAVPAGYEPELASVPVGGILAGVRARLRRHPAAARRRLRVEGPAAATVVETDAYLLERLLAHLVTNALEASPEGAEVTLVAAPTDDGLAFRVWNPGVIPPAVAPRIFQRYFTTRPGDGRGQGTFVVKHFGEKVLRGRVRFTSTREDGTTFELAIPRALRRGAPALVAL